MLQQPVTDCKSPLKEKEFIQEILQPSPQETKKKKKGNSFIPVFMNSKKTYFWGGGPSQNSKFSH